MSPTAILIVEAERIDAEDLGRQLRRLGYEVAGIAASGAEAIALTCRFRPALVLIDISLNGPVDSIAAAEAIRRRQDVPVVFLLAYSDSACLVTAKFAESCRYLVQPWDDQELASRIESALQQHQADRPFRDQSEPLRVTSTNAGDAVVATNADSWPTATPGFNPDEALSRCFNNANMVRELIRCFLGEVDCIFHQMRTALAQSDLVEVGRLGHQLKGTVAFLGAQPAKEAALRVERFCECSEGTVSEAEEAINALEYACLTLKAELARHPLAADPG